MKTALHWLWRFALGGVLLVVSCVLFAWILLDLGEEHSFYCHSIRFLDIDNEAIYFWMSDSESNPFFYVSQDAGSSWQRTREIPDSVVHNRSIYMDIAAQPITICNPQDPMECYRTSGYLAPPEIILEESRDGGVSWNQQPFPFQIRHPKGCPDPRVSDFAFMQTPEGNARLFVALDTGGLAVRMEDGEWEYNRVSEIMVRSR